MDKLFGQLFNHKLFLIFCIFYKPILGVEKYNTVCHGPQCEFFLSVAHSRSMTYHEKGTTYNVELNGTRLVVAGNGLHLPELDPIIGQEVSPDDVVTLDGTPATIITINNKFPGPTLEVMEGTEVIVHVKNRMYKECMTIHWHGIHHMNSNWMDGAAYVTQCPILPHQNFTYRFTAYPPGTHWYHSHIANQRTDGLFGMLIIHRKKKTIPHIPLMVQDWYELNARDRMVVDPWVLPKIKRGPGDLNVHPDLREYGPDGVQLSALTKYTGLINGRGRPSASPLPLTTFTVKQGEKIILCVANTGSEYAWELSLDKHTFSVVASDGYGVRATEADFVTVEPGETFDLEVIADQEVGNYWLRARTLRIGVGWFPEDMDGQNVEVRAIFRYTGAAETEPETDPIKCSRENICRVFNCNFENYAEKYYRTCIHYTDAHGTHSQSYLQEHFGVMDTDYEEFFLNFAFPVGASVNARRYLPPSKPLITDGAEGDHVVRCDSAECDKTGCACTHVLNIPFNKTIQLVLANLVPEGQKVFGHHPIHIHGYSFAVMATGYPEMNSSTGHWSAPNADIHCDSKLCAKGTWRHHAPVLNTVDPIVKDTLVTPARGYTVVRFRSTNPGYWFVHCHAEQHVSNGMNLILNVGGSEHHRPLPSDFPTCSNYYRKQTKVRQTEDIMAVSHAVTDTESCAKAVAFTVLQMVGVIFGSAIVGGLCLLSSYLLYHRQQKKQYCDCPCGKELRYKKIDPPKLNQND